MNKFILMGITGEGKVEDLKQLINPIKSHFDRIIWGFHSPKDEGYEYLKSVGEVIDLKWCGRFDLSRNITLSYANLKRGDVVVLMDDAERLKPAFFDLIQKYGSQLFSQADIFLLHNKRFIFIYNEFLQFKGNPHEGLHGGQRYAELTNIELFSDSNLYFENTRNKTQTKFDWFRKYLKYYLLPTSNHILLGCEDRPELVQRRSQTRMGFLNYLDSLGVDHESKYLIQFWENNDLTDEMKFFINQEKILNDSYRMEILGEKETLLDNHDYENINAL